ncbi:MAG: 5'-nucleotidase C-terminal domain-containing protein [Deltaproteobacteria bacterium]|nr:5'-nucleotidase C-terminal domain-containing protein [Deltaproteobacteria bacterium]MBI3296161.1 5'-nucleotidase C-terminal domain-containing protein [Deltaproteobacteria bacterium]
MKYLILISVLAAGCENLISQQLSDAKARGLHRIVILATNDIHGGLDEATFNNQPAGGMAIWASIVRATRQAVAKNPADGVLLLDGGDQFQGTLLSNFDEGLTAFKVLNAIGYDAAVPGNHAFDFGPVGWLEDKVNPANPDKNIRGAWDRVVKAAQFPLVSANTYLRASLVDKKGQPVQASGIRCESKQKIDWAQAERPQFATPYLIKNVAGVRVAIIGIDHARTSVMTTPDNVSDLCFRDELESYLETRRAIAGKADVFVLLMHNGDTPNEHSTSQFVQTIVRHKEGRLVDAVVAGHTHYVNFEKIDDVPFIQSGANGEQFGRIELIWDGDGQKLLINQTKSYAGLHTFTQSCDKFATDICSVEKGRVLYDGVALEPAADIVAILNEAKTKVSPIAGRVLGKASALLKRDRINESPLADMLTDEVRRVTGADIVMLNTGGMRADIPAGIVTYETLFRTLPFSNHGVTIGPMGLETVLEILRHSAQTCGAYGAIMQSGLKVTYTRHCELANGSTDPSAEIRTVELERGGLLFDSSHPTSKPAQDQFQVATFDFLASGGDGYSTFSSVPLIEDFGILREALTEDFLKGPGDWDGKMDGRWKLVR